ncbi:MAG: hypothetical protein HZC54_10195 [Verrucomicrobia bacterium]|nr:hypothetical protein [Verrucomicrobiota bacterium]
MNPLKVLRLPIVFLLLAAVAAASAADGTPKRLKRADSFFGIHFDFHARADDTNIGANTTPVMVEEIINLVRPDYLQVDCKGHRGFCSYPTKVGHRAPSIVGDPLRVWRDVTAKHGVGLYMHYSGVWDSKAVEEHPDWAALNADSKPNTRATSFFGPYAEKLLIPQLRELAGDYGVDGMWVDGECWASVPDYGVPALAAFRKATGITNVPRKPGEPHWHEFLQFNREMFRKYLRHYIAAVKKTNPKFQICSNWAFTDHMAEPVSAPVDFLSGDYSPQDSVNSARLSARYLARQGKPWDLMAWSFSTKPTRAQKTAVQLQREAAVVLAMGGGFQAYFTQNRDGSVRLNEMPVMAEVAKFCRARQAVCHHAQAVPQIGLLLSTTDQYRRTNGLFSRDLTRINGALHALLESQWSVEVLGEHQLAGRLRDYPLIVIPECEYLDAKFRNNLAAYVKAGGNLLLIGPSATKLFERELGGKVEGETKIVAYGRGKIACSSFSGQTYLRERPESLRRSLNDLARQLFPKPMVEVKGSNDVDVCLARNHGKLLVNLVNTAGPHKTQSIIESIPPVGPLDITLRLPRKPAAVTLEPGARPLSCDYRDGQLRLTVPKVEVHEIVAVQMK